MPVRALIAKYRLGLEHFLEIIAGVEMDLDGVSYATWDDLRALLLPRGQRRRDS